MLSLAESTITDDAPAADVSSLTEDSVLFDEQAAVEQIISAEIMIDKYFFIFSPLLIYLDLLYHILPCISIFSSFADKKHIRSNTYPQTLSCEQSLIVHIDDTLAFGAFSIYGHVFYLLYTVTPFITTVCILSISTVMRLLPRSNGIPFVGE